MTLDPSRRALKAGFGLAAATLALGLALGCARRELQTAVELGDFALYQRDNVQTEAISAGDELAVRLAAEGWRVERDPDGALALVMRRDRARLWFFSADGGTTGAELWGELLEPGGKSGRRARYRLNGSNERSFAVQPGAGPHPLEFERGAVRQGWNALELRMRRIAGEGQTAAVRLAGVRFRHGARRADPRARVRQIETIDGVLRMPAGAVLDAVFEVPPAGRFSGRLAAEAPGGESGAIEVSFGLTGENGEEIALGRTTVAPGETVPVEHDLGAWQGDLIRLRTAVAGPPRATAVWLEARVEGNGGRRAAPFARLIQPVRSEPDGRLGRPDVFVILLDAARADAFSPWGGPYPTPALEALAAAGTKFSRTISPSSWTGQSMPAIFTGFYPETVGVRKWGDPLTEDLPTLAELFERAGYHTVLWSQHPLYSRGPTLSRGFRESVFSGSEDPSLLPAMEELAAADGEPTFAFIHLLPPHGPYTPPAPFRGRYTGWYDGKIPEGLGLLNRHLKKSDLAGLSDADRKYLRDRYQENVAFADHLVGRLIAELKAAGRYNESLIAVISDHGEAFLEHQLFLHSRRIYQEYVQVPFVVKWPASTHGFLPVIEDSVTLLDLAPTLVSGLGLEGAERGFQGIDLLPLVFEGAGSDRALYAITRGDGDTHRASKRWIRFERDGWSLVWGQVENAVELYDLRNDPSEQRNLAADRPTLALELLQELQMQYFFNQTLLGLAAEHTGDLDPELARELRALGYLW